ncbi:uncharacterized protein LOC103568215 [Microplitis demolitor]|uniref:uncharacterized protein LOC103568215 n=1 Tax=Microplitis demolitor TaxID=69319 RepID=UPI0004CD94E6|nr:uncharacterized protein LOC103568215 [Microplitis demolitor]
MSLRDLSLILLLIFLVFQGSRADTRYLVRQNDSNDKKNTSDINFFGATRKDGHEKSRAIFHDDESMIRDTLKANHDRRNSFVETSTFDPDVLNKFLDEYASKIKSSTDKNYGYLHHSIKPTELSLEIGDDSSEVSTATEDTVTIHGTTDALDNSQIFNDTSERNKFFNGNQNDDRDSSGWVTLEAIPWSKSKISKWQANTNSQRPWQETNKWDKPSSVVKPWTPDYVSSRPHYSNNKPWYDKPKPNWPEYETEQLKPTYRPYPNDHYEPSSTQAQKWPPERPSSSYDNNHHPIIGDIITDNRPSNFPTSNWDKYDQLPKPSGVSSSPYNDRYHDQYNHEENNNNWPGPNYHKNKYDQLNEKPGFSRPHKPSYFTGQYEYENHHPPTYPSSGDGQWVLLSTNRGYSRQRSLKFDSLDEAIKSANGTTRKVSKDTSDPDDSVVPVMTSKRQVRLTVLPSLNGNNTTTSHGGLLEVEKTFKTVDESQKEFAAAEKLSVLIKKPLRRQTVSRPSNAAVLAAVGAGMLPATMGMMLPIMLGRKKRSSVLSVYVDDVRYRVAAG